MDKPLNLPSPTVSPGPAGKPSGCTNFKLRQLLRRVAHHYDQQVSQAGLKTTQYSLLSHVLRLGPLRPGELARVMTMDASTLSRNLKPLVAAGYLEMSAGEDARSRLVRITEAGRAKRAEAQRHWRVAQESLNELLGLERVVALHGLVDEAMARLTEPEGESDE
jgi:DNA-binding MarR family transcriptional regulator